MKKKTYEDLAFKNEKKDIGKEYLKQNPIIYDGWMKKVFTI
jgi:hypothetical protein